jgi:hypothetical protein
MNADDVIPLEPACEWDDVVGDSYIFQLSDAHRAELDAALVHAESRGDDGLDITRDDFPLPTLGVELRAMTHELVGGRRVALIRGVPVERYGKERASSVYWGIGMHLGLPWPQNANGLRGENTPGTKPWYTMPIFTRTRERLFVRYIRPYIEASRRHEDAPRPSDAAREAMNRVDEMCADPQYHVSMTMQPGDMQFVNSYHVLHARDEYQDDRPAGRVRHLKRLWLETDVLSDNDKPECFRLGRTDNYWASKGRTRSELVV